MPHHAPAAAAAARIRSRFNFCNQFAGRLPAAAADSQASPRGPAYSSLSFAHRSCTSSLLMLLLTMMRMMTRGRGAERRRSECSRERPGAGSSLDEWFSSRSSSSSSIRITRQSPSVRLML